MISFIKTTLSNLLMKNPSVGQALLTGVLPVTNKGFLYDGNDIDCFCFMDNHPFSKYYGLRSEELDKIINKLIKDDEERSKAKTIIDEYYNGYNTEDQNIKIYSIWSVLQYLRTRKVQSYWYNCKHMEGLNWVLHDVEIKDKLMKLLYGEEFLLDTSCPMSVTDVLYWVNGKTKSNSYF